MDENKKAARNKKISHAVMIHISEFPGSDEKDEFHYRVR